MKLNAEQRSQLIDLLEHPGYRVFEQVLASLVKDEEQQFVRITLKPGVEMELAYSKARAEGASRLQHNMIAFLERLRKKDTK